MVSACRGLTVPSVFLHNKITYMYMIIKYVTTTTLVASFPVSTTNFKLIVEIGNELKLVVETGNEATN